MRSATVLVLVSLCSMSGCKTEQSTPGPSSAAKPDLADASAGDPAAVVDRPALEGPDPSALPPAPSPDPEPLRSRAQMVEQLEKLRAGT